MINLSAYTQPGMGVAKHGCPTLSTNERFCYVNRVKPTHQLLALMTHSWDVAVQIGVESPGERSVLVIFHQHHRDLSAFFSPPFVVWFLKRSTEESLQGFE